MIRFNRVTGPLGADVYGIDLRQPLSAEAVNVIRDGLLKYLVLFFREQELMTFDQHLALVKNFGEPESTPFHDPSTNLPKDLLVLDQTDPTESTSASEAAHFHSDGTFRPVPAMGAILQAHIVPEYGGDTCFASMYAAYDGLSPRMQVYLDGLEAYHSYAQMIERLSRKGKRPTLNPADYPPVKHPVVARHPETGRKLLFVNFNWTTHIDGISYEESTTILRHLYEHIKSPTFQVRLRWNKGDVVFWDNRVTQHYAVPDYNERRMLHRIAFFPHTNAKIGTRAREKASV